MKPAKNYASWILSLTLLYLAIQPTMAHAQLSELFAFQYNPATTSSYPSGANPMAELIQGADGNYYTTTNIGGAGTCPSVFEGQIAGCGAVVKITPTGTLSVLYSFPYNSSTSNAPNGGNPQAGLVQGFDGNFYGVASIGGSTAGLCVDTSGCGTVFKLTKAGVLTVIYAFCGGDGCGALTTDGSVPVARLAFGSNGKLYGTTSAGGPNNNGAIFSVSTSGAYTLLHVFNGSTGSGDGWRPLAGLTRASNGNFYGTTIYGGSGGLDEGEGTVFEMTPAGAVTILHSFVGNEISSPDGAYPKGALVQASDGNLYGTCSSGGANGTGTAFRISLSGTFTKIYDFEQPTVTGNIGSDPQPGLIQASDGNLYGTAEGGGAFTTSGTIYQLTLAGAAADEANFVGATTGFSPLAAVVQGSDGRLYTTLQYDGGANSDGVQDQGAISVLNLGLAKPKPGAFVFGPTSGLVGAKITLLGSQFIGTTAVDFNGIPAAIFGVDASGFITAEVPTGASSGKISVTNAGGTTTSKTNFTVLP